MKSIIINRTEFTEIIVDTEPLDLFEIHESMGLLVHDIEDENRDGDFILIDAWMPENEEEAETLLTNETGTPASDFFQAGYDPNVWCANW